MVAPPRPVPLQGRSWQGTSIMLPAALINGGWLALAQPQAVAEAAAAASAAAEAAAAEAAAAATAAASLQLLQQQEHQKLPPSPAGASVQGSSSNTGDSTARQSQSPPPVSGSPVKAGRGSPVTPSVTAQVHVKLVAHAALQAGAGHADLQAIAQQDAAVAAVQALGTCPLVYKCVGTGCWCCWVVPATPVQAHWQACNWGRLGCSAACSHKQRESAFAQTCAVP